jgi:hypothetical protein
VRADLSEVMGTNQRLPRFQQSLAILPATRRVSDSLPSAYPLATRFQDSQYEKKPDRGELCELEFRGRLRRLVRALRFRHPRSSTSFWFPTIFSIWYPYRLAHRCRSTCATPAGSNQIRCIVDNSTAMIDDLFFTYWAKQFSISSMTSRSVRPDRAET